MSRTPTPPGLERLQYTEPVLPGAPLPAVADLPPPLERLEQLADLIDDAVVHALRRKDVRAYMEAIATSKPDLFFKYVQLAVDAKKGGNGGGGRAGQIISPLAPTALDRPMN